MALGDERIHIASLWSAVRSVQRHALSLHPLASGRQAQTATGGAMTPVFIAASAYCISERGQFDSKCEMSQMPAHAFGLSLSKPCVLCGKPFDKLRANGGVNEACRSSDHGA